MDFTDKEIEIIRSAEKNVRSVKVVRIMIFLVLCAIVIAFFSGMISERILVYVALGAPVYALLAPQIGVGPKYEQLTMLLSKKLKNQ